MPELRELERKLQSIRALREIVNAMRNLAAVYVRRADVALQATRPYAAVVETALRVTLDRDPARGRGEDPSVTSIMALVFASDQGLCGSYNERVTAAAVAFLEASTVPVHFVTIGRRADEALRQAGIAPVHATPAPTSLEGIKAEIPELARDIFAAFVESGAERLVFIYNAYENMGRFREETRTVLPPLREQLHEAADRELSYDPILTAPVGALLLRFVDEYFFIQLYRAMLESHASENGARLLAMTAAGTNIDRKLVDLTKAFQTARQENVTSELLDVVGGAEAALRRPGETLG